MLYNTPGLKYSLNSKSCFFVCDPNMDVQTAKEACFQFLRYLGEVEEKQKNQENQVDSIGEVTNGSTATAA
jgi:hypothetical protein